VIRLGLVGYGYWGPNYARIIDETPGTALTWCADVSEAARAAARSRHPTASITADYRDLLAAADCDAVIIAAPTKHHFEIASAALEACKHMLVEKPLTDSLRTAAELAARAQLTPVICMVGHVFLYHPAVCYIASELQAERTGPVRFIVSSRMGYSPIRQDVDALWDLAPHDVSMIQTFMRERPVQAFAVAHSYYPGEHADVVFGSLRFPGGALASLRLSWAHPFKERRVDVVAQNATFSFDDVATTKLTRYDGIENERAGTATTPMLASAEPLRLQFEHFVRCIQEQLTPLTGFREGEAVVATLEALSASMRSGFPSNVAA